jgi:hypothetical protein
MAARLEIPRGLGKSETPSVTPHDPAAARPPPACLLAVPPIFFRFFKGRLNDSSRPDAGTELALPRSAAEREVGSPRQVAETYDGNRVSTLDRDASLDCTVFPEDPTNDVISA